MLSTLDELEVRWEPNEIVYSNHDRFADVRNEVSMDFDVRTTQMRMKDGKT